MLRSRAALLGTLAANFHSGLIEQLTQSTYYLADLRLFRPACAIERTFQRASGQRRQPLGNKPLNYSRRMDSRDPAVRRMASPLQQTFTLEPDR